MQYFNLVQAYKPKFGLCIYVFGIPLCRVFSFIFLFLFLGPFTLAIFCDASSFSTSFPGSFPWLGGGARNTLSVNYGQRLEMGP